MEEALALQNMVNLLELMQQRLDKYDARLRKLEEAASASNITNN